MLRRHLAGGAEQGGVDRAQLQGPRETGRRHAPEAASIRSPENMGGIGGRIGRDMASVPLVHEVYYWGGS
jgi:hypothetical protein